MNTTKPNTEERMPVYQNPGLSKPVYNTNARDREQIASIVGDGCKAIENLSPTVKQALINKLAERVARLQVLVDALKAAEAAKQAPAAPR